MAEQQNTPSHDLKHITESVPEPLQGLVGWSIKNWKILAAGLTVVVVAILAVTGVKEYQAGQIADAQQRLGVILSTAEIKDQADQIDIFLKDAPAGTRAAALLAQATAAMESGQYAKSAEAWAKAVGETSGTTKIAARLGLAKALLLTNKADDALAEMKDLAATAPESYAVPVQRELALAAEAAGDTATAKTAYEKLAELGPIDSQFIAYKLSQLNK